MSRSQYEHQKRRQQSGHKLTLRHESLGSEKDLIPL